MKTRVLLLIPLLTFLLSSCGGGDAPSGPTPSGKVEKIEIHGPVAQLEVGESFTINSILTAPGGGIVSGTIAWSSSNGAIASVKQDGVVTAASPGTARISAGIEGKTATADVTVGNVEVVGSPDLLPSGTLAFTGARSGSYDIFTVGPAGVRQVTTHPLDDEVRGWNREGTRLGFFRSGEGTSFETRAIGIDGTGESLLLNDNHVPLSPDFSRYGTLWDGFIMSINIAKTDTVRLTPKVTGFATTPSWSPDGTRVAYIYSAPGDQFPELYVANADGTGRRAVSNTAGYSEFRFSWSADSRQIVYMNTVAGLGYGIGIASADGSSSRQLTLPSAAWSDENPSISPDGRKVAFESNRSGTRTIFVVSTDGGSPMRFAPKGVTGNGPKWGPGGDIAFAGTTTPAFSERDIWVISGDRRRATQITTHPAHEFGVFWKP